MYYYYDSRPSDMPIGRVSDVNGAEKSGHCGGVMVAYL